MTAEVGEATAMAIETSTAGGGCATQTEAKIQAMRALSALDWIGPDAPVEQVRELKRRIAGSVPRVLRRAFARRLFAALDDGAQPSSGLAPCPCCAETPHWLDIAEAEVCPLCHGFIEIPAAMAQGFRIVFAALTGRRPPRKAMGGGHWKGGRDHDRLYGQRAEDRPTPVPARVRFALEREAGL